MQLNEISAVVRPRDHWEATDLGVIMVRAWGKKLYLYYLAITLPFYCIISALFFQSTVICLLILWWLKPLFDRIHLHILSRALFGEIPTFHQVCANFFKINILDTIALLTIRRLSFSRSFDLPVTQLEKLSGTHRRNRLNLLHHNNSKAAFSLHTFCFIIECLLSLYFMIIIILLVPTEFNTQTFELKDFFNFNLTAISFFTIIIYYIAVLLVSPFYMAGGFALYVNRRTHLEGWDIELVFRKLAGRASKKGI